MNLMHDRLVDGRNLGLFSVIDNFDREVLGIELDLSLLSERIEVDHLFVQALLNTH